MVIVLELIKLLQQSVETGNAEKLFSQIEKMVPFDEDENMKTSEEGLSLHMKDGSAFFIPIRQIEMAPGDYDYL